MRNYVLMHHLSNEDTERNFLNELKKKFPKSRMVNESGFRYFSFAERNLPGVHDALQESMDGMTFEDTDYIALFYTREEEPDIINRLMIFGRDNRVDNELKRISRTTHENILTDLLEFDFIKPKS